MSRRAEATSQPTQLKDCTRPVHQSTPPVCAHTLVHRDDFHSNVNFNSINQINKQFRSTGVGID